MDYDLVELGIALRKVRKEKGYTMEEVANHLGLTYKSINHWEQGLNEMKLSHLVKLCNLYQITIDELFDVAGF